MVLPVTVAVVLVLCFERRWSQAACWAAPIIAVLGAVAVLKSLSYACGWIWPALDPGRLAIRSPSGHAASAAVLYGSLVGLLALRSKPGTAALLASAVAGVAMGVTRVLLGSHSPAEVVLGLAVGLAGALAFGIMVARQPDRRVPTRALAAAVLVIAVQHGRHLAAEQMVQERWSLLVRQFVLPACVPH